VLLRGWRAADLELRRASLFFMIATSSAVEREPTPDPSSAVRRSDGADERRPYITEADLVVDAAMVEAAERYAGEMTHDCELEDLRAGRHPLQQQPLAP
jgi:hypothetical protein